MDRMIAEVRLWAIGTAIGIPIVIAGCLLLLMFFDKATSKPYRPPWLNKKSH